LTKISIFGQDFLSKFRFLVKISIVEKDLFFLQKNRFLVKISIVEKDLFVLQKNRFLVENHKKTMTQLISVAYGKIFESVVLMIYICNKRHKIYFHFSRQMVIKILTAF